MRKLKFIDLFAGLGGFHIALRDLGHTCVFASEINVELQNLYKINHGLKCEGDITSISIKNIPKHDIVGADILDSMAVDGFDKYLQHTGVTTGQMLGSQIEEKLQPNKRFIPVKDLSDDVINNVLTLVEKISERPDTWG